MFAYDKRFQLKEYGVGQVGAGWAKIVGDIYDVIATCNLDMPDVKTQVIQVKEKFATLRFYFGCSEGSEDQRKLVAQYVNDAIRKAEQLSAITCEACGAPGTRHASEYGYVLTLCPACQKKREAGQSVI